MMQAYLRKVVESDRDILYQWANDPAVRAHSFSGSVISFEEHQEWFSNLLKDPKRCQYIYIYSGEAIGQIRLDITRDTAEVGYSIRMDKRCMGHGKIMLQLLAEQVKTDYPQVKKLTARVKPENIASQKVFLDTGFEEKYQYYELEIGRTEMQTDRNESSGGGVLFLTNNRNTLPLFDWLHKRGKTTLYSEALQRCQVEVLNPDFIISYNYRYKIADDVIAYMKGNIINLHISFLPWNRGTSPNIWSFIDHTPQGVTIHQVSSGLDRGMILYQKECSFDIQKETFATSYQKLNGMITELFQEKWEEIRTGNFPLHEQKGKGSYHEKSDLDRLKERLDFRWDEVIAEFLARYREK